MDPNPLTRQALTDIIAQNNTQALEDCFSCRLTFGTAGLRGKMGVGPARMNELTVLQAAQGITRCLLDGPLPEAAKAQGVVIGHDHRHNSHSFALTAAAVFLYAGFTVYMLPQMEPTPYVPWCASQCSF